MQRMLDVVAARLLEGSLVPYLGPWLHREPPHPRGEAELAAWLRARAPEAAGAEGLPEAALEIERGRGRRRLNRLLREAYARPPDPAPLHLLLAALPVLPLAVSAFLDGALLEVMRATSRARGRGLALVHGLSPADERGVFFAEAEGEGLRSAAGADTVVYQPLGGGGSAPSYLVTEADLGDVLVALESQAPIPPEVQRRREGCGFLLAGCRLEGTVERLFARGILQGAAGPHFAVLPGRPGPGVERFLAAEGITLLPTGQERFVAGLSQRMAQACLDSVQPEGWWPRPAPARS